MTITDRHLEQATENVQANPRLAPRVRLQQLSWGPAAEVHAGSIDLVVGADLVCLCYSVAWRALPLHTVSRISHRRRYFYQVYPNNAEESLGALLATLQALRRPSLLAYVERSTAVTEMLEAGLRNLSPRPHCRRLRLAAKTHLYALEHWVLPGEVSGAGATPATRCTEVTDARFLLLQRAPATTAGAAPAAESPAMESSGSSGRESLTFEPLEPFGSVVHGLDWAAIGPTDAMLAELAREVASRGFLVFPNQSLSSDHRALLTASRGFGSGAIAARHTVHPEARHEDVLRLSNREAHGVQGVGPQWHSDGSFERRVSSHVLFHAEATVVGLEPTIPRRTAPALSSRF